MMERACRNLETSLHNIHMNHIDLSRGMCNCALKHCHWYSYIIFTRDGNA